MKYSLFTKFSLFLKVSEVCNISNKCLFPSESANKIFLNKTSHTPPSFQNHFAVSIADAFRNIHLLPFFLLVFTVHQVGYISNKYQPPNNNEYFYTRHLIPLIYFKKTLCTLDPESCRNIRYSPHFYQFSQRCAIFQIKTNVQVIQQNINIFTKENLYSSFSLKKIGTLNCKRFSKHHFSLHFLYF